MAYIYEILKESVPFFHIPNMLSETPFCPVITTYYLFPNCEHYWYILGHYVIISSPGITCKENCILSYLFTFTY